MGRMIDKQRLSVALSTIKIDADGRFYSAGDFLNLSIDLKIGIAQGGSVPAKLQEHLAYIKQDNWNLQTLCRRLDWQKRATSEGKIDDLLSSSFAACDINLFHVQFRSLFDYLAKVINLISDKPGQVPSDSFEQLYNWVERVESNRQRIGDDLARIVASCDWFKDLRGVRNSIVHFGGETVVFPETDRILFQVYDGFRNRHIHFPEIMFNENIVDFELYSGLLIGYLITCLEEVSLAIRRRLDVKHFGGDVRSYHGGLPVIRNWIEKVVSLEENNAAISAS
jgi:hypothetical protein